MSRVQGHQPDENLVGSTTATTRDWFRTAAHTVTLWSGSWQFFVASLIGIIGWALLGPMLGYSDTWQLIVNTPTTVLTYLIGILILLEANRQGRESKLVHDELLRAIHLARNELVDADAMTEEELAAAQVDVRRRAGRPD